MDLNNYLQSAINTLKTNDFNFDNEKFIITNAMLGMVGETGELIIEIKKRGTYALDVKKELGDIFYYFVIFNQFSIGIGHLIKAHSTYQPSEKKYIYRDHTLSEFAAIALLRDISTLAESTKKYLFHGKQFDIETLKIQTLTAFYSIIQIAENYSFDFNDVMQFNIERLKKRYPKGFSEERSLNRNE